MIFTNRNIYYYSNGLLRLVIICSIGMSWISNGIDIAFSRFGKSENIKRSEPMMDSVALNTSF